MVVCCIVPLLIAGILYYYFNLKTYALLAVMLLCPILHYFLMRDMHKNHSNHQNKNLKNKESCH